MKEALKLALEALEDWDSPVALPAIYAIKKALAQPEQEPVGRFAKFTDGIWREVTDGSAGQLLYTTPPKRPWVGLTDEERNYCVETPFVSQQWANIEATLKEKNT